MATPGRRPKTRTPAAPNPKRLSAKAERWIAQTLRELTTDEKIGQLFAVWYYGGFLSTESHEYQQLLNAVEQKYIGSFAIQTSPTPFGFKLSQVYPTAILANALQSRARIPLLIGADFERGTGMRIEEGTSFPHAMAVAATGRPEDAYTVGKITALEGKAIGVPWIFAPDADVNSNPENPIINTRSFGEDVARVSEFAVAFIRGVQENGGLATTKHFPGHGDTSMDSHLSLPTVTGDTAHLEKIELAPFRAAIAARVGAIMTGHLAVPALDSDPGLPATISAAITTGLLRRQMGFDGLVVTDALDMGGVAASYSPGEVAVRAIMAGADILLVSPVLDAALEAVREAVALGRIPIARLDDAVTHVLRAKATLGLHESMLADPSALAKHFAMPEFARAALDIADRGVTLLRDDQHILPLDATKPTRALLVAFSGDPDPFPAKDLEAEIRWRADSVTTLRMDTRFVGANSVKIPAPDSYDVIIAALFVRVADRKGSISLPGDQASVVDGLLKSGKPVIIACFGSPYLIERFPAAKTWISVFSTASVAQRALGRALFGEVPVAGRLPVNVPGVASLGAGMNLPASAMQLIPADAATVARLKPVCDLLDRAVAEHAFPGGVLAVGAQGMLAVHAFGRQTYEPESPAITPDTMYDAASLTKAVVTTTLVAVRVEAGVLKLDSPVEQYLPEWNEGPSPDWRRGVTLRHLLAHTSGLPGHKDYFLSAHSDRDVVRAVCKEHLEYEPGTKSVYSDLDFILLGEILRRVSGLPLDQIASREIFQPLGMNNTIFNPPNPFLAQIVPTEHDTAFRNRLVHGEVHDENAFAMGGVAGHAGMFSTASDLAAFCQMLLNGGIYGHRRLLTRETICEFTAPQPLADGARTLGWMVPTSNSSSGHYFSGRSFGHTGFTGTSIWIDSQKQLFVILLTNRVYPTRANSKITAVRPVLHDAVLEALGLAAAPR